MKTGSKFLAGILRIFTAIGALIVFVTVVPVNAWMAHRLAGSIEEPEGEVLIVLSGGKFADGVMAENSLLRSFYAVRAYQHHKFQQIIITGGGAPTPIAESMKEFIVMKGVPKEIVTVETAAQSTRDSAVNLKPMLDRVPGRRVLLTSDYHMFRARRAFEKAGIHVLINPVPDVIKRSESRLRRWQAFQDLALEATKVGYYFSRSWI
jgi:uncharacterized SAM-binding protein YcdF (DUF218 family)